MDSVQQVQEKIAALEAALRQTAFDVLNESRSYDQAARLLKLAESLKELESEFAKVMHPPSPSEDDEGCTWWGKGYPRFCIRDDRLVKEAKGKKSVVPYTQEVDHGGFDVVVNWISQHAQAAWQMTDMVEELSGTVAGYKPYAVVGALGEAGLVRRVKRGSYRAVSEVSAEDWWALLEAGPIVAPTPPEVTESTFEDDIPF
ncbi:MAG: hypothetical protein KGZ40_01455 [Clostridiales bacterium]|nr:hypothetical protein [Clostridiales bacterium]